MANPTSSGSLARRLGVFDAVVIGLGSMLGAGVFIVWGPAAAAARSGVGLILGLVLAAVVAFCNAESSARLAARYPQSGGTYVYGRERLGEIWGFIAGWGFVAGKIASCGAMALAIGAYIAPEYGRPIAVVAVVLLTLINSGGITKTAALTRGLVVVTLGVLAVVCAVGLGAGAPSLSEFTGSNGLGIGGVLQAGGLLFFAFAGYARIATLGEEVRNPERTIPRAIPLALTIVLVVYVVVGGTALAVLGPEGLARSVAPLVDLVEAAELGGLTPVVRAGAAIAVVGVLLSLLAGVARTVLAMARNSDLPGTLATVERRTQVPFRAQLVVSAIVVVLVTSANLVEVIGFSSCTVLVYYAITNAAAFTLGREPGRRLPVRVLAIVGINGCLALAISVPLTSVVMGVFVLVLGVAFRGIMKASNKSSRGDED